MKLLAWVPFILFVCLFLPINGKQISIVQDNGTDAVSAEAMVASYGNSAFIINTRSKNNSQTGDAVINASCAQIPEEKPPDLVVSIKKDTVIKERADAEAKVKFTMPSPITEYIEGRTENGEMVDDEDGMSIVCNADYPVYLEFQLNDGYFKYFFRPDVKHCKCEQENCTLCFRIGIWLPMKVLNFVEQTQLVFICRSMSGRAPLQKKAVLTRRRNVTHNMEILTISTEKLEPSDIPSTSTGGTVTLRIGKCQLDSYDDHGFLREAFKKFPSCKEQNNGNDATPCLEKAREKSGRSSNSDSVENSKSSPLLDMEVLKGMTCKFGNFTLLDGAEEHNGSTCGEAKESNESDSDCCPECVLVMLIFTILFTVPLCWMVCMKSRKRPIDITLPTSITVPTPDMHVKWKVKRIVLVH